MFKQIIGKEIRDTDVATLTELMSGNDRVVIDLGTGDGKFAYTYAQHHPQTLVIGIDAAVEPLRDLSHKSSRKPAKGGLSNLIYVWAAAERLPGEFAGIADEVYVNFPWGSLLSGVVKAEPEVMSNLTKLCKPSALVHIYLSYDTKYEPETMQDLELPELSSSYLEGGLKSAYTKYGLEMESVRLLDDSDKQALTSSWPKKILSKRDREVYYVQARLRDYIA